jgi:CHAT domain-containing protein
MKRTAIALAAAGAALCLQGSASAEPISVKDSFRIGTGGTVLCTAQALGTDPVLTGMFDRGYTIVCRDAVVPIGRIYALRADGKAAEQRLAAARASQSTCAEPEARQVEDLGTAQVAECHLPNADVGYRIYLVRSGKTIYAAEGLAGYDSALRLGLRTVIADQPVKGELSVATTGAGDPAAFARVQAGTLDYSRALAEAYRRNNAGSYAESAEFFESVRSGSAGPAARAEAVVNEALQKSNLGRYAEADSLFSRAADLVGEDPIVTRQLRNYRAMHLLNQGQAAAALKELDRPLPKGAIVSSNAMSGLVIDETIADRLNSESPVSRQLGSAAGKLLPEDKAQILDGQALQLRGTALRLSGDRAAAATALFRADSELASVRGGRVSSIVWMRAQILGDLAAISESAGDAAEADRQYRASVAMLNRDYPGSSALLSAEGRLAGYLARSGRTDEALGLFRSVVQAYAATADSPPSLARILSPYLGLLLKRDDPASTAELFEATQVLVRPGVAQTQAVLARELSGGSDEASRLFRQSVNLTRQIERGRVTLARMDAAKEPGPGDLAKTAALRSSLGDFEQEQVATQAKLGDYPRFRAVSSGTIALADLQKQLRPGEAYYKMTVVDDEIYAVLVMAGSAKAVRLPVTASKLDVEVDALRDTISTLEDGRLQTFPFDVALARELYKQVFGPFDADMPAVRHLIFEPDGAMLRLPPNLLVMRDSDVAMYAKRAAGGGDADFDFTGIHWLGRDRDVSTSVSARAFRDVRVAPPSAGRREYLGLGQNSLPSASQAELGGRGADLDCVLALSNWTRPISSDELFAAKGLLSRAEASKAEILTKGAFTDTAIKDMPDLDQFRIIHFATHGIVTAPRRKCPAQPALMTSFGGEGSDGLLTFREIFDLHLDADLVILSACDTAGRASITATRDAGLATGGDFALDGLVRAFVGAGGRLVIASHWPVPDDYGATKRLVSGLFTAAPGTATATALRLAEQKLMDDPNTSHPFYWAGFAAIGDGAAPVIRRPQQIAQVQH